MEFFEKSQVNQLDEDGRIIIPEVWKKVLGKIEEPGSRSYIQRGLYLEYKLWSEVVFSLTNGDVVSPGGASAMLKVSRSAVYSNVRAGRLTMWTFIVMEATEREFVSCYKGYKNIWVPCCELDAWNAKIKWGRSGNSPQKQ